MSVPDGQEVEGFVEARWSDLETVALVATLDPRTAREATTASLADLRRRWSQVLEEGPPTTAARRALLERVAPAPRRGGVPGRGRPDGTADRPPTRLGHDPGADGDEVTAALMAALAAEGPPVRALLAAEVVWELPTAAAAALLGRPGLVAEVDAARGRLLAAHRAALAAQSRPAADHDLDPDLADLVHDLGALRPEPPDPASVVDERVRRVRRRTLVLGGGVAAAAGGVAWWGLAAGAAPAPPRPTAAPAPTTPGPSDPVWATSLRWPPRGVLTSDFGVQALVARTTPGGRLLYADDIEDVRVVVASTLQGLDVDAGTQLRLWTGAVGAPAEQLTEIPLGYSGIFAVEDVVAVGVPHPTAAALLVLSRPDTPPAELSVTALPRADGGIDREWEELPLQDGVLGMLLDAPLGPAARIRCRAYDGPLPRPVAWDTSRSFVEGVAAITGLPTDRLTARTVDAPLPDDLSLPEYGEPPHVLRLDTATTPDGGVVRSLSVAGSGGFDGPWVVPARQVESPWFLRVDDFVSRDAVYAVLVPATAATVELRAATRSLAPAVRARRRVAVVRVNNADVVGEVRIRVRDFRGRITWDAPPLMGRYAYDVDGDLSSV